jgi:GrpB-like predicted nucleotidyltransferase (UPF0157 family)
VPVVEIVPASPAWPVDFQRIGHALRDALGAVALRIDHIGSTSVPALPAKDVIDVQVTVAALDDPRLVPAIESAGFLSRNEMPRRDHRPPGAAGPDADWVKLFFAQARGSRRANLHVRAVGSANQRYALLFRDYLRAHPEAAEAYAELKRRLAALGLEVDSYADVKDPACDLIMIAAEPWAEKSGWRPGPSDA